MPLEIERKFLLDKTKLKLNVPGVWIIQGYMLVSEQKTIRVRIAGEKAFITIKGPDDNGVRTEFEYNLPVDDATYFLKNFCLNGTIEKTRYAVEYAGKMWEIDEFQGKNAGLWLAEIELKDRNEEIMIPEFIKAEVTGDKRYHNSYLASHPFPEWK